MAIATGSSSESYEMKIKNFGDFFKIGNYFQHIVKTKDDPDVKLPKPAPDAFLVCAKKFKPPVDPSKCLVFEDSSVGVDGAVAAGMQVVMVPDSRFKCTQENATQILKSLEHFQPELYGLPTFD